MRLPRLIRHVLIGLICAAAASAAAQQPSSCEKDIFVYLDVSDTMRDSKNGPSRLSLFALAIKELLTGNSDFLSPNDRVRLVTFATSPDVLIDRRVKDMEPHAIAEKLTHIGNYVPTYSAETINTDMRLPLNDLRRELDPKRTAHVILASDLVHDPANDRTGQHVVARQHEFNRSVEAFRMSVRESASRLHFVILQAPTNSLGIAASSGETAADPVATHVLDGLMMLQSAAERKRGPVRVDYDNVHRLTDELKARIALAMNVGVILTHHGGNVSLALRINNPNPFPVRLLQARVADKSLDVRRTIACSATSVVPLDITEASSVQAVFDTGSSIDAMAPAEAIAIDVTGVHIISDIVSDPSLLVEMNISKHLTSATNLTFNLDQWPGKDFAVRVDPGAGSEQLVVTISVPRDVASGLRSKSSFDFNKKAPPGIVTDDDGITSDKATRKRTAAEHAAIVWKSLCIVGVLAWFVTIRRRPAREFGLVLIGSVDIPATLASAAESIGALTLCAGAFIPSNWIPPDYKIDYWVRTLPTALLAGLAMLYVLRGAVIIFWDRKIEPRQGALRSVGHLRRLARLLTLFVVIASIGTTLATLYVLNAAFDTNTRLVRPV